MTVPGHSHALFVYAAARAAVAARALADTPDAAAPTQAPALAPPVVVREADDGPLFLLAHGGS